MIYPKKDVSLKDINLNFKFYYVSYFLIYVLHKIYQIKKAKNQIVKDLFMMKIQITTSNIDSAIIKCRR